MGIKNNFKWSDIPVLLPTILDKVVEVKLKSKGDNQYSYITRLIDMDKEMISNKMNGDVPF
jgi:hypothetical protein